MPLFVHSDSCCDVCLGYYEWHDTDRHPHAIACGHIFCKACLSRISHPEDGASISNAPCPLCRKLFTPGRMKKLHVDRQQPEQSGLPEEVLLLLRLASSCHEKVPASELENVMEESNIWLEGRPTEENVPLRRLLASIRAHNDLREAYQHLEIQMECHSAEAQRTQSHFDEAGRKYHDTVQKLQSELEAALKELERIKSNGKSRRKKGYVPPSLPAPPEPVPDEQLPEFLRCTLLPNSPENREPYSTYLSRAYPSPASPEDRPSSKLPESTMPGGYFSPSYPEYQLGFTDSPSLPTPSDEDHYYGLRISSPQQIFFTMEPEPRYLDSTTEGFGRGSLRWDLNESNSSVITRSRSPMDDSTSSRLARIDTHPPQDDEHATSTRRGSNRDEQSRQRSGADTGRAATAFQPDTHSPNLSPIRPMYTGPASIYDYSQSPLSSPVRTSAPAFPRLSQVSLPGDSLAPPSVDFGGLSNRESISSRPRTMSNNSALSSSSWGTAMSNPRSSRSSNSFGFPLLSFSNGNGVYASSRPPSHRSSQTSLSGELFPGGLDFSSLTPGHIGGGSNSTRNSMGSHQGAVPTIAEEPDSYVDESDSNEPRYATIDPPREPSRTRLHRNSGSRSHRRSISNPVQTINPLQPMNALQLMSPLQPMTDRPIAAGPTLVQRTARVPTRRNGSGSSDSNRDPGRADSTDSTTEYASYASVDPEGTSDHGYAHYRQPAHSTFRAQLHHPTPPPLFTTTYSSSSSDTVTPNNAAAHDSYNSLGLELGRSFDFDDVDLALQANGLRISQPRPVSGSARNSLRLMNNEVQRAAPERHPHEVRVTESLW